MWEVDAHAEGSTCVRKTHMREKNTCKIDVHEKRKACEAHMQEDLARIGLGFW
jgi:hypothetical protein